MTKFINNLCLYLLHAVFSLVKPAISNTYLILMGFFQVFLQLHSSFKSKQQASHSSITPKFLGSMYFSAKGDAPSPMQIPFLQIQCLLASCLLCAYCCCCLHSRLLPHSTFQCGCCPHPYTAFFSAPALRHYENMLFKCLLNPEKF